VALGAFRMAAGAHFFSDVVFAGVLMYLVVWTAHGLIYRWPATRLDEKALEDWLGQKGEWFSALAGRLAGRWKKAS
jgi:membrane-associated phospholipid phosphatase